MARLHRLGDPWTTLLVQHGEVLTGEVVGKDLRSAEFGFKDLRHVEFKNCDLRDSNFEGAKVGLNTFDEACKLSPNPKLWYEQEKVLIRQRLEARAKRDAELRAREGVTF